MKTITKNFKISTVLLLAVFLLCSLDSYSSHWRFGQLTWKPNTSISPTTAEFTFTAAFRWNGYGNPPVGAIITETVGATRLYFGDGSSTGTLKFEVVAIDPANNWFIGIALQPGNTSKTTIDYTYLTSTNGGSPWAAYVLGCCRTGTEINNPNRSYRVSTLVELASGNRSPVSSLPAIVNMSQSATASFLVPASDPDPNTTLTYRLATSAEAGSGFTQPAAGGFALSVDPSTGLVSWNTTAAVLNGLYSTQIIIEDRDANTNAIRTTIALDFLIQIVSCDPANSAPLFVGSCGSTLTVAAGDNLTFTVEAEDSDVGDNVNLNTGGVPTGATMTPELPVSGLNGTSSTFSWNTTLADGGNNYVVSFSASDDCGVQTLCSYTISVVACSIDATAVTSDVSCSGSSDGAIDLTLSGNYGNATFAWTGPDGFTATTEDLTDVAAGSYTVVVSGDLGCSVTETFEVGTIPDVTAPVINILEVEMEFVIWPPNHKYETYTMGDFIQSIVDNCNEDLSLEDVTIVNVTSDEPEDEEGDGDGNTIDDIVISGDCKSVQLRKERQGTGNGRVYTIYFEVDDGNGNTGYASSQVTVPHNVGETAIDDIEVLYDETCGVAKSSFISVAAEDIELKNYPNPFKGSSTIQFSLVESNYTKLVVYNSLGREVATLYDGMAEAEQVYKVEFNALDLAGGVYFYHLQSGESINTMKKMMLIK